MRPRSLPSLHQVMVAGGEEPELEQLSTVSLPAEIGHTSLLRLTLRGPTVREIEIIFLVGRFILHLHLHRYGNIWHLWYRTKIGQNNQNIVPGIQGHSYRMLYITKIINSNSTKFLKIVLKKIVSLWCFKWLHSVQIDFFSHKIQLVFWKLF